MTNNEAQLEGFEEFLSNNTYCEIVDAPSEDEGEIKCTISKPWNDPTLSIFVPKDAGARKSLADALEHIYLPPQFSAIYHRDDEKLEVLWTAYRLNEKSVEVKNRNFEFNWQGKLRTCKFSTSSNRLLEVAKNCFPNSVASSTDHRNILSFHFYATKAEHPALDDPISFWIDCSGINENDWADYAAHLNAYMTYFDLRTPKILVHMPPAEGFVRRSRYVEQEFPVTINAKRSDPTILAFWNEVFMVKDMIMRFLLCYRMSEYAAFNYLDAKTRQEMRRLLNKPSLPQNVDGTIGELVELFVQSKEVEAIPRMQNLVSETVCLKKIWEMIDLNCEYFRRKHTFEGGFEIKPLLSGKCDFDTWEPNGVRNTLDRLRQIRNALSHGQDGSTRGTIHPTKANSNALIPWVNLIEIIAGDVMLQLTEDS